MLNVNMGKTSNSKGKKTSRPYNVDNKIQCAVSDTRNLSGDTNRLRSNLSHSPLYPQTQVNLSGVIHSHKSKFVQGSCKSVDQQTFSIPRKKWLMQTNSCEAMQQEDVSVPLESSETSETSNTNVEENVEQNVGSNAIPEADLSTMKEESIVENEDPLQESPVIEEAEDIDVEKYPTEDGVSAVRDSSEDEPKVSDIQYCEFQCESENDKELTDMRNSENNYDPVSENNEEFDEENIEISVDEAPAGNYETNGLLEDVAKDDPAPCSNESHLNDVGENCLPEENIVEEDSSRVLVTDGASTDSSTIPTLSLDSNEVPQVKSHDSEILQNERENEHEVDLQSMNTLSPGNGTWGGKIRSISSRRPVRKLSVPPEESFARASRSMTPGKATLSTEENLENDCRTSMSESLFTSLKRKAFDADSNISLKKSKIDSSNSTFLSMVSSPLQLLKNKISDRIIESPKATHEGEQANGNSKDETVQFEGKRRVEVNDKNIPVPENSNQISKSYKSWCSVM